MKEKSIFITRNMLSVHIARNIVDQYGLDVAMLIKDLDYESKLEEQLFPELSSAAILAVPKSIIWDSKLYAALNFFSIRKKIKNQFKQLSINKLFVTYPVHPTASIWIKIAKKMNVSICFYEEGTCYYRELDSQEYVVNSFRSWIKHNLLALYGLAEGYQIKPDEYFAVLPNIYNANHVDIKIKAISLPRVKNLYLSRPLEDDYCDLDIPTQIEALALYCAKIDDGGEVFIKFHPRESINKRKLLLAGNYSCKVIEIKEICSAEEIVSGIELGGSVCGCETATLAYSNALNKEILVYSTLMVMSKLDSSGMLAGYFDEYRYKYPWIRYLE